MPRSVVACSSNEPPSRSLFHGPNITGLHLDIWLSDADNIAKMKIFISQAGARGLAVAEALGDFVRLLVPDAKPWISTELTKGKRWGQELADQLRDAGAGMICLTPENLNAAWILFEAGALSHDPAGRVWLFLLDVTDKQLGPQLDQFQNTKLTEADVRKTIYDMNEAVASSPRSKQDIDHLFDKLWPDLEKRIEEIRKIPPDAPPAPPVPPADMVAEILATVRDLAGSANRKDSWRTMKTMLMLSQLYREITGKPAPSMAQLIDLVRAAEAPSQVAAELIDMTPPVEE